MAWTAPRTWTVGELVTAAYLNTHIRDNLNYLKGDTTDIQIGTTGQKWGLGIAPTRQHHIYGAGQTVAALTDAGNAGGTAYLQDSGTSAGNGGALIFGAGQGLHAGIKSLLTNGAGQTTGDLALSTRNATGDTALTERMRITAAGLFGFGQAAPRGIMHAMGSAGVGRWLLYDFSALGGTTVVIVPDGAGDCTIGLILSSLVKASNNATPQVANGFGTVVTPGGNTAIYSSGGTDIAQFRVLANGQIEIQRTLGSATYQGLLLLQWF